MKPVSNIRLENDDDAEGATHAEPKYALMGLVGAGSEQFGYYLIRAEQVPDFLRRYYGYEQKSLDDWSDWSYWLLETP